MSSEDNLNKVSAPATDPAPSQEFEPMPVIPSEQPRRKEKEYDAEVGGLHEAAADLTRARAENRIPQAEPEPIDRSWKFVAGEKVGEPVDPHYTLTKEQAADGLKVARALDTAAAQPVSNDQLANTIDQVRAQWAAGGQPFDPNASPVEQPQATIDPTLGEQQQTQQPVDGVDPEIAQALSNPKIRDAISKEIQAAETARAQYADATLNAARVSASALLAFAPELASIPTNEIGTALQIIGQQNPARAQAIREQFSRTQALFDASKQAQAHQQQLQAQQFEQFSQAEDQKFEAAIANENPETVRAVKQNVRDVLEKDYGIDKNSLKQLWETQPLMRTAEVQRMLYDITRMKLAERSVQSKIHRDVPPVQRPGVGGQYRADDGVDAALKAFNKSPDPKTAAALLTARRNATRR
jgi:hypothetical protein